MAEPRAGGRTRTTLADVAAEAGVSQATVSRALAGSPLVNRLTRERIWEVAERLRFTPNRLARSLRSGATLAVGLVVPDVATTFYASALKSAQSALEAAGYHVLVANTERAAHRERDALRTLAAHQVDGVIVATSGGYEDIGVPAVFFDNVPAEPGATAVAMDNAGGMELLVEHLVQVHGHRAIAYLGPSEQIGEDAAGFLHGVGRERMEAFRAAAGAAGMSVPPDYLRAVDGSGFEAAGRAFGADLVALESPPTAMIGGADSLALGLLRGLRDTGRRVPEDVALVSFDQPAAVDLLDPPVASLDPHDAELGRRAAELLLGALIGGRPLVPGAVRVPLQLRPRRSCGCA